MDPGIECARSARTDWSSVTGAAEPGQRTAHLCHTGELWIVLPDPGLDRQESVERAHESHGGGRVQLDGMLPVPDLVPGERRRPLPERGGRAKT